MVSKLHSDKTTKHRNRKLNYQKYTVETIDHKNVSREF